MLQWIEMNRFQPQRTRDVESREGKQELTELEYWDLQTNPNLTSLDLKDAE